MTISAGLRRGFLLAATGIVLTGGAARAQEVDAPNASVRAQLPQGAVVQPINTGPGAELRRNLVTLADNPRSLTALIGAGRASLEMGDAEAALSFFARADDIDPANARVKAGMAAALVQMERPDQALPLFARAMALGAPESEIAADRGLAYDLAGEPHRAQQDYHVALRRGSDAEVERRLALSLAISGQRSEALRVLDPQLRRRDRAGWRTQAFVLALTGDPRGAEETATRMIPAGAQAMIPFFQRLHMLTPAQKAAAVHFGRFPAHARSMQVATYQPPAEPQAAAPPRARPQPAEPLNRGSRRRSRSDDAPVATLIRTQRGTNEAPPVEPRQRPVQMAEAQPQRFEPPRPDPGAQAAPPPVQMADVQPQRFEPPKPEPEPEPEAPAPSIQQADIPPSAPATPGFSFGAAEPTPESSEAPAARTTDFSAVTAIVQSLPTEPSAPPPARPVTREPRTTTAATRPTRTAEAAPSRSRSARNTPPPNPARHWVQIAGGANRSSMPREFARLREQAPAALNGRTPYTTPANATNRLLVGPFASEREAQAFVNRLGQSDVRAFAWTSAAGQEIERLRTAEAPRSAGAGARPRQEQARTTANDSRASRNRSGQESRTTSRGRRSR